MAEIKRLEFDDLMNLAKQRYKEYALDQAEMLATKAREEAEETNRRLYEVYQKEAYLQNQDSFRNMKSPPAPSQPPPGLAKIDPWIGMVEKDYRGQYEVQPARPSARDWRREMEIDFKPITSTPPYRSAPPKENKGLKLARLAGFVLGAVQEMSQLEMVRYGIDRVGDDFGVFKDGPYRGRAFIILTSMNMGYRDVVTIQWLEREESKPAPAIARNVVAPVVTPKRRIVFDDIPTEA